MVGDVRNDGLNNPTVPEVYLPGWIVRVNPMAFVVRSQLPSEILMREVRHAVQGVDAEQPVYAMQMMADVVQGSVARQRLQSFIVSFFSVAALLMAVPLFDSGCRGADGDRVLLPGLARHAPIAHGRNPR